MMTENFSLFYFARKIQPDNPLGREMMVTASTRAGHRGPLVDYPGSTLDDGSRRREHLSATAFSGWLSTKGGKL